MLDITQALNRLLLVAGAALASLPAAGPSASTSAVAYVDVSVATLWARPGIARATDRPSLGNPVDMRAWSRALDTSARRWLVGKLETQALYGEQVRVLERRGGWSRVVVTDQPTPRDARGYPGWVPSVQLTAGVAFGRLLGRAAVVTRPTTLLRTGGRRIELSYGTRLPVVRSSGRDVVLATPDGGTGRLSRAAVAMTTPRASPNAIVAAARMFLGVRYLWAGTSAFGFDCSGLIHLVYRVHGIRIPRDADAQARKGKPILPASSLRPGDLLFYGRSHVHHVALYLGGGTMLEAPNSATSVRVSPMRTVDFAGARRYLP